MNALANEPAVILIIDEDALTLTGIAAVLNLCGHECHCARDRAAALKAVRTLALDLILCDVDLRDESGLDLCRDLRCEPGVEDVPLMFISAAQMPDIVRRTHEAGGAYYLRTPFDPDVLIELVAKALWMPHLVTTRVSRQQARPQSPAGSHLLPAPHLPPAATPSSSATSSAASQVVPRPNLISAAIQGIRIPLA